MADARITYNLAQVGKSWKREELPPPFSTLDPGSATFADAVATFQAAKGLSADGKLGPNTLVAMRPAAPAVTAPAGSSAAALIAVCQAEADKKVREVGRNAGPDVERYQRAVGLSKGSPWCAAFVSWCYMASKGLTKAPGWCSGSAVSLYQTAGRSKTAVRVTPLDADFQSKVKAGMVWSRAQDAEAATAARKGVWCQGHTGIVVKVDSLGFHTIEGNTNAAGSREGDGVYCKLHKWSDAESVGKTVGWFDPETV
jgi:hypothetical protein